MVDDSNQERQDTDQHQDHQDQQQAEEEVAVEVDDDSAGNSEWCQQQLSRMLARREQEARRLERWRLKMEQQRKNDSDAINAILTKARALDTTGGLHQRLTDECNAFRTGLAQFHDEKLMHAVSAATTDEEDC